VSVSAAPRDLVPGHGRQGRGDVPKPQRSQWGSATAP